MLPPDFWRDDEAVLDVGEPLPELDKPARPGPPEAGGKAGASAGLCML